jgi:hypothetical protein
VTTKVEQWLDMPALMARNPALTKRLLRYWRYHDVDGFRERCCVLVHHKAFFDVVEVEKWLEEHRLGAKDEA